MCGLRTPADPPDHCQGETSAIRGLICAVEIMKRKQETWSRGTNSRLTFDVNMKLNLFDIFHGSKTVSFKQKCGFLLGLGGRSRDEGREKVYRGQRERSRSFSAKISICQSKPSTLITWKSRRQRN